MESLVRQSEDQVSALKDDEIMLMSIQNGRYYNLNRVSTRIWQLIEEPRKIAHVCDQMIEDFDVPRQDCQREVLQHIGQLVDEGLARVG